MADGVLGWRPVSHFDNVKYAFVSHIYNGSHNTGGYLRDTTSTQTNKYVTRYPAVNLAYAAVVSHASLVPKTLNPVLSTPNLTVKP